MDLREALSILSKSSPYAVATSSELTNSEFDELKKCLYVETEIEAAFRDRITHLRGNEIVFLCGSSGDGKSEILTRYRKKYEQCIDFHLDATHSFAPDKSAIETLDDIFQAHSENKRPLVVGINIGMLGNYEREGSNAHRVIKQAISSFLSGGPINDKYTFLDFESFPKFSIASGMVNSPFFSKLLDNVVKDDSGNKFREYFNKSYSDKRDPILMVNYLMLRNPLIQKVIVELLLNARIRKDQFVTARMLLDFTHSILTGPHYLFDNLFGGGDNELLEVLADFDPSVIRNHELDLFVLHRTLELQDDSYLASRDEIAKKFGVPGNLDPQSTIRLFYLLKYCSFENNYHRQFKDSFNEQPLIKYKEAWELHNKYTGDSEEKKRIRDFYSEIVFKAINSYANRNAPYLDKDQFYLSSHGACDLAAEVQLSVVYQSIEIDKNDELSFFNMYLSVDGERLDGIPISVNLLELMMGVVQGYRPNKYDKNSVVLLDELITKITETASASDVLYLYRGTDRIKIKENSDKEIIVSGL
jgi:DNA phosphorothioation-dependent restriction protein DptF